MTTFIVGAVLGSAFGLFVAACCVAAGREDEAVERYMEEHDHV